MHTSGNSSIDTSLICDIYSGPEVLFETCVTMKFVDDDDDDDDLCITELQYRCTREGVIQRVERCSQDQGKPETEADDVQ